jgi:transcriptional regulator with XRE-family HTH domain
MYVYEKVRFYIEYYGITQNAVAKKAGISNVTLNAILNGKRRLYADDLRAICIALNVPPEMFIDLRDADSQSAPTERAPQSESDDL